MYLIITESPAKAKKIATFLSNEYNVKSSCGHITDLEKKKLSIDVDNNFKPTYKIMSDKKDVVKMLKTNAKDKKVIFAADDDREGEAIAWHTANTLKCNIDQKNRIIFREISKKAILKSLKSPQKINMDDVNAQQARRIIDRLIGFKLSPCLWKHIKTQENGLSAGRVQSALLNLVKQKKDDIKNHESDILLDVKGVFTDLKDTEYIFKNEYDIDNEFISTLMKIFIKDRIFNVYDTSKKKDKSYPKKPFITSTLQQTSQETHGFPVNMTMNIAQKLYEEGHITYMRTDSTYISEDFQNIIKNHLSEKYDKDYYQKPNEKKVKGAQEAHEAIRPTSLDKIPDIDENSMKLYNLIKKRTITSHMKPTEYDVYKLKLNNDNTKEFGYFTTNYKQLTYPGHLIYGKNDIEIETKPSFNKTYHLDECISTEKESNKPSYYNESMIVNLLEQTGIGRPSTYATIIATLGNRKYTTKEDVKSDDIDCNVIQLTNDDNIMNKKTIQKGKLQKQRIMITPLGEKVLLYLNEHFSNILHKDFTCNVELDLDLIANGKLNYIDVIKKVYNSFISIVDEQMNLKLTSEPLKHLGDKNKKKIYLGNGKFGPYLQIINENDKKKNISIQKYLEIIKKDEKDLSFDDAITFLKYPMKINTDITIHMGPYGYYMKYKGKNYTINQSGKYSEEYCLSVIRI
jgi:DNA topoisomerase I